MLLKFKTRIGALLHNHDEAKTVFDREFDAFYKIEQERVSNKCTYAFLAGSIVSAIIYGIVFYQMKGGL